VLLAERWIIARLRHRHFTSLGEANAAISECVAFINSRPFKKLDGSRKILFEALDRPALRPLPPERYEFATWRQAKVNIDYHIEADHHYYSVPYQLVGKVVYVRSSATTIEAFYSSKRVASHLRSFKRGQFTTDPAHMPESHRRYAQWTRAASSTGRVPPAPRPRSWSRRSSSHGPSRAGLPLRARHHPPRRSLWHRNASRRRVAGHCTFVPTRIEACSRSLPTASTNNPCPRRARPVPSPPPERARGDLLPMKGTDVLSNTTIEGLHTFGSRPCLRRHRTARAPDYAALGFEDRLGLLVDREHPRPQQ